MGAIASPPRRRRDRDGRQPAFGSRRPRSAPPSWRRHPARSRSATAPRPSRMRSRCCGPAMCWWWPARATRPARSSAPPPCPSPTPRPSRPPSPGSPHDRRRPSGPGSAWSTPLAGARQRHAAARRRRRASRSTPARSRRGELFFAIKGEVHDGHDFVARRLRGGRRRRRGGRGPCAATSRASPASTSSTTCSRRPGAARPPPRGHASTARDRRRDGLGRQDLSQGGAAPRAGRRRRDPCLGGLLQQPLGRAADAGARCPPRPASASSRSA